MAGKLCTGSVENNAYQLKSSKAFCEGLNYRASGNMSNRPSSDDPHETGSDASNAWNSGWTVANAAGDANSAIDPTDAPCCAVTTDIITA